MSKNIYQKIADVQKAVAKVAKDTTVKAGGGSYKAVSHDAVLSAIREAVIDAGIVITPTQMGKGVVVPGQTNSGNYKHRFEAVYSIEFINIDEPADRHSVEVEAHADDNGDKAPGKAISYATKTAQLKVFLLATGENDEERMEDGHYNNRGGDEKPWYNNFNKDKDSMVDMIAEGKTTAEEILVSMKKKYKISKQTQQDILAL